jgi:hypothetical protein
LLPGLGLSASFLASQTEFKVTGIIGITGTSGATSLAELVLHTGTSADMAATALVALAASMVVAVAVGVGALSEPELPPHDTINPEAVIAVATASVPAFNMLFMM